jgi:alpha-tubulin suppressor-like RCC1 family protein
VQSNNTLWCWGDNNYGQLGTGDNIDALAPAAAGEAYAWTAVDSGPYHSCAITTGRDLYCWGLNNTGQIGDNSTDNRNAPVLVIDGADLPSTNTGAPTQASGVLAQLALLAALCALALRVQSPRTMSKRTGRR